jgi:hypothetical protein
VSTQLAHELVSEAVVGIEVLVQLHGRHGIKVHLVLALLIQVHVLRREVSLRDSMSGERYR